MSDIDENFFDRADEHIFLSNKQMANASMGTVSASMMYSVARFNAWVSATGFNSSEEMNSAKRESVKYFVEQYEKMLLDNMEDYIENFDNYMKQK